MRKFYEWMKKESWHVMPAFLFFFVAFYLINMTDGLMMKKAGISPFGFTTVLIAAGVVAKILAIIDNLPFIDLFPNKPLMYNIVWKTTIYGTATFLVRILDRLIPFFFKTETLGQGFETFMHTIQWPVFWAVQIWYVLIFFIYVFVREFVFAVGADKSKKLFFG